jgi:hypothetical protein
VIVAKLSKLSREVKALAWRRRFEAPGIVI